jgi:hypothetical protein
MRLALAVSLVLALLVLAAPASAKDPTGSCTVTAASGTKETHTCRLGPIAVAPYQVLTRELLFNPPKPMLDGHVTDMEVDVVDADGTQVPINRLMLHHIVFLNLGSSFGEKRDLTCGNSFTGWDSRSLLPNAAERFYAAGEERAKMSLPNGHGYPIAKDDSWLMTYMLMNHRSRVDRAYIQYEVTVDSAPGVTPVKPYWLDVKNCLVDPVYDVPGGGKRGSTHRRSYVWNAPEAGRGLLPELDPREAAPGRERAMDVEADQRADPSRLQPASSAEPAAVLWKGAPASGSERMAA